jgi:polysaccharide pyruvyl transferase WcaK-like protein
VRILVVNTFQRDNRGDAALLSVTLDQLHEAFPGARVEIAGFEDPDRWPSYEGVPNLGSIRRWTGDEGIGRLRRISRKSTALGLAALATLPGGGRALRGLGRLLPAEPRAEVRALTSADLVVSACGGYLNGRPGLAGDLSVGFLLLPLWLACRSGVPVVLGPQSLGPFPSRVQRLMARRVLGGCRRVVARESISVLRLTEAGVPTANVLRGVDVAFGFRSRSRRDWRRELGIPTDGRMVLMTARQYLDRDGQQRYERAMAGAVRHLIEERGCTVVLAPQVTCDYQGDDDRVVNARIAALVGDPRLLVVDDGTVDHHDIFALYRGADAILGTRFHSVIFGLVAQVPCAAVEYEHKTYGIMADLSLEHWVVPMAEADEPGLVALLDRLLAEAAEYRHYLAAVVPNYAARAHEFVRVLRDLPEVAEERPAQQPAAAR